MPRPRPGLKSTPVSEPLTSRAVRLLLAENAVELVCAGDTAKVALHGAQILSWKTGGLERLYLSPRASHAAGMAIRGGIPVCFPQFNQRGPAAGLPKHGFARLVAWQWDEASSGLRGEDVVARFMLADDVSSRTLWPHAFAAALTVRLAPGRLTVALEIANPGTASLAFTAALHSYLSVGNVENVRLCGLDGRPEWDAVADVSGRCPGPIEIAGEFDRVYEAGREPLLLEERESRLQIEQSATFRNTVVWNPGAALCATLPDMPPEDFRHMLCVEAAQVESPVVLAPGESWSGWQRLAA